MFSIEWRARSWLIEPRISLARCSLRIYLTRSSMRRRADLARAHINAIIWREPTNTWVPRSAAAPRATSAERVHRCQGPDVEPFQAQLQSDETNSYLTFSPNLRRIEFALDFFFDHLEFQNFKKKKKHSSKVTPLIQKLPKGPVTVHSSCSRAIRALMSGKYEATFSF